MRRTHVLWMMACAVVEMVLLLTGANAAPTAYYVSNSIGSDAADGLAAAKKAGHGPWKTLARASAADLAPGDRLLLRCGDVWSDTLTLRSSGTAAAPITLGTYGAGPRPYLRGTGRGDTVNVTFDRSSGWRVTGLEFGFARNAIKIVPDSRAKAEYDGFRIEDCFLHDIANPAFPNVAKREGSRHTDLRNMGYAIFVDGFDSPGPVHLKNVVIRHCVAHRAQGFYIHVMGPVTAENVTFDGNTLSHISYNAIYQAGASRFNIVNSVLVYGYPWAFHPNGATQVLAGGLDGTASARNEVSNNEFGWGGDYPGCPDGCAYDFEGATNGVAFRHNVLHDTSGEPVLFMGGFAHTDLLFDDNILRNCVAYSTRWDSYVTVGPSNTGNGAFTNNRFFVQPGKRAFMANSPAFTFENNEENATGRFADMPLVTRIQRRRGGRAYSFASSTPGAVLRYTTDGSLPGPANRRVTSAVLVTRSGALNVRAFREGMLPSYTNALVVDLRDQEGRAPALRWNLAMPAPRGKVGRASDTFSVAMRVEPRAPRESGPESNAGVTGQTGQQFALAPNPGAVPEGEAGIAVSVGTNGVGVYETGDGYQPCMLTVTRPLAHARHIVVVYRDRQPTLYIDGVFQKAGCRSERTVRPRFRLTGDAGFRGQLTDVRVYGRALTDAEIQQLARNPGTKGIRVPRAAALRAQARRARTQGTRS